MSGKLLIAGAMLVLFSSVLVSGMVGWNTAAAHAASQNDGDAIAWAIDGY